MRFILEPLCSLYSETLTTPYSCDYHCADRYSPGISFITGNSDRKENGILKSLDTETYIFIYIIYFLRNYALSSSDMQREMTG
jgi:hypothetical protein